MLVAICHCGAVRVAVPSRPAELTDCNGSICRRYGTLWALYPAGTMRVLARAADLVDYLCGARISRTVRCRHCGCVTHWEPLRRDAISVEGVNARNFEPGEVDGARMRRFDGATSWAYVD